MVDLDLVCVVATCFAGRWWRVYPSVSASPSAVDAFARLAHAFAAVAPVLEAMETSPLEEMTTLIAVPPHHRRFYFPKVPHFIYSMKSIYTNRTYDPPVYLEHIGETGNEDVK